MIKELTPEFISTVMKLPYDLCGVYNSLNKAIEIVCKETSTEKTVNIHEFIYTHCTDFLLSYANGLSTHSKTKYEEVNNRKIPRLYYRISLTVPNLMDGGASTHKEIFEGNTPLLLYVNAVEWLITYRRSNPQLSKFWINKF